MRPSDTWADGVYLHLELRRNGGGVWDFKGPEGSSHGDGKQMLLNKRLLGHL